MPLWRWRSWPSAGSAPGRRPQAIRFTGTPLATGYFVLLLVLATVPYAWRGLAGGASCLVGGVPSPRSGDGATAGQRVPLRQRMRAALKLLFGLAKTAGG